MRSGLQHKLLNYEVIPPAVVWDKINAELDESELDHMYPSALYTAEVDPPISTWNKIQLTLNAQREAAEPVRKRYLTLLRYAAAAIFTGLLAWGGIQLLNKKSANKEIAANEKIAPVTKETSTSTPQIIPEKITINTNASAATMDPDEARNDAALEASKRTFAKLEMNAGSRKLKNIAAAYRFALSEENENYPGIYSKPEECAADNADRYIMVMNAEGKNIRISKKLSHLICCVSGDEESRDCKDQMSQWREKIACSTIGHSTSSFLDIFSFLNSLQEQ